MLGWPHPEHQHGATRIVTPNTLQDAADHEPLARYTQLSTKTRAANASCWSGQIPNEPRIGGAWCNAARAVSRHALGDLA